MKCLDFIIIGAQKAGTTSLYHYLREHPGIYMPPEKEAPFFTSKGSFLRDWEQFAADYFGAASVEQRWGKATPAYMADPRVAARIHSLMPRVLLIALLRNPVERAYSHYMMSVRRGWETRDFATVIEESLQPEKLSQARTLEVVSPEAEQQCYIAWGEYGRILTPFYQLFPRDRLQIFFTEELDRYPEHIVSQIVVALGLNREFKPKNISTRYHVGGYNYRFPWLARLPQRRGYNFFWRVFWAPGTERLRKRKRFEFWLEIYNTKPEARRAEIDEKLRNKLREHYSADIKLLKRLVSRHIPWPEFYL